jgi:hypothetical protein
MCSLDSAGYQACGTTTYPIDLDGLGGTTPPPLPAGRHTLSVYAVDPAGNADPTPATYSWTIDLTPPNITSLRVTKSGHDVTMRFGADEPSKFQCKRDSGAYVNCTSPKVFSGVPSGNHTFTVRPKDRAGNLGLPESKTIRV